MKHSLQHLLKPFIALAVLSQIVACSGSGGGGGNGNGPGPGPNPEKEINFDLPIDTQSCMDPFLFVNDWQEKLKEEIEFGRASCVKKAIELGANPKSPVPVDHFDRTKTALPLHFALESSSLFFASSERGQSGFEVLKVLVDAGASLNAKNNQGQTVLQASLSSDEILKKYLPVPKYIIQSGKADLEVKDSSGNTPLLNLLSQKNKDLSEYILAHGANPQARTLQGTTTLQLAVENSYEDLSIVLLGKGVDPTVTDRNGNNTLHRAAALKMASLVNAMISKSTPLNRLNGQNESAVLLAAKSNATDIAKALIQHGADPNLASFQEAPIHAALRNNNSDLSNFLIGIITDVNIQDQNKSTPLILAAKYSSIEQVKSLLDRKANANLQDQSGETALMYALTQQENEKVQALIPTSRIDQEDGEGKTALFYAGNLAHLNLLIENKADLNHVSKDGQTVLSQNLQAGQKELSLSLIQRGANLNWTDSNKKSLLHLAMAANDLNAADAMINKGLSVHAETNDGKTPLFFAQSPEAIDLLVRYQADLNHMSLNRETALMKNALNYLQSVFGAENSYLIAQRLLQRGANPNVQDSKRRSLLHWIAVVSNPKTQHLDLLALVLEKGANVNAVDSAGNTCLHGIASESAARLILAKQPNLTLRNADGLTAKAVHLKNAADLQKRLSAILPKIAVEEENLKKLTPGSLEYQRAEQRLANLNAQKRDLADSADLENRIAALL